jgi:hypothetical protein
MADDNNMYHGVLSLSNNNHTMVPTDEDFITELTHQMSQFMLQEDIDDSFDFSSIASQSHNSELVPYVSLTIYALPFQVY